MTIGVRSKIQTLDDSVNLKDNRYIIDKAPILEGSFRVCELTLKDDVVPRCSTCGSMHVKRRKMETFERWDIINRMPTRVRLHVRRWQCLEKKCNHPFIDPRSPYDAKGEVTEAFQIYIAETLLSSTNLPQQYLAERYHLSKSTISRMLTRYIKNSKHKLPPAVPCEDLWFLPFKYQKKWRLLILGRPDRELGHFFGSSLWCRIAFLGIADKISFELALKSSNIAEPEKIARIHCPESLRFEASAERLINEYNVKVYGLSTWDPIFIMGEKLIDILKDLQARGFSLKQASYMMRYTHAYRTPIIQKAIMRNNASSMKIRGSEPPFKYTSLLGKSCYYVDTEALVHIYGKQ